MLDLVLGVNCMDSIQEKSSGDILFLIRERRRLKYSC